VNSKTIN